MRNDQEKQQMIAQMQMQEFSRENQMDEGYLFDNMHRDNSTTRWQQDLSELIEQMKMDLRRQVYDDQGKRVPIIASNGKPIGPLCSDECVESLVALLKPNTSFNLINSKYDEDSINREMFRLECTVIHDILLKERKTYKTSLSHLSEVKKIFHCFARPTFFRSLGGFEAINQRQIRTIKELHTDRDQFDQQKKSRWLKV